MTLWPDDFELQDPSTIPRMAEEAREQCRLVAAMRRHWAPLPDSQRPIVFSVPNGGKRNAAEGANLKAQGALAGIPDLIVWLPGGRSILIEMKAHDGHLSGSQVLIHNYATLLGFKVIVAYSAEDALSKLRTL